MLCQAGFSSILQLFLLHSPKLQQDIYGLGWLGLERVISPRRDFLSMVFFVPGVVERQGRDSADRLFDRGDQRLLVDGLLNECHRLGHCRMISSEKVLIPGHTTENDHRYGGETRILVQLPVEIDACVVRHDNVQGDQIRPRRLDLPEGVLAVFGSRHFITVLAQQCFQENPRIRFVVNDQNFLAHSPPVAGVLLLLSVPGVSGPAVMTRRRMGI
jgi:hypothetical protein